MKISGLFSIMGAVAAVSVVALVAAGCGKDSTPSAPTPPSPPPANRPPVIASLNASPTGTGLASATIYTFTGLNISDPDGDALTYTWTSSDAAAISSTTLAASHVYDRTGSFEMRLTVTDSKGASTSSAASVNIGSLTGTWDFTCNGRPAGFPAQFVVLLTQIDAGLFGTISAAGLSQGFPAPVGASAANMVGDPRSADFGVEASFNVWAVNDGDFYFHMTADNALTSMTGSSQYCASAIATRR